MTAKNKLQALVWAKDVINKYDDSKNVSIGIRYKAFLGLGVRYLSVSRTNGITKVDFIK